MRRLTMLWQYVGDNVTAPCNYNCPYCYESSNKNPDADGFVSTWPIWTEAWENTLKDRPTTFYISFGEPTISKEFPNLIKMIGDHPKWDMIMTTNLSLNPVKRYGNTKLVEDHRLFINASFHPSEVSLDKFVAHLDDLRSLHIEPSIIYVLYPPVLESGRWKTDIDAFDQKGYIVHVRRFQGMFKGKVYPQAHSEQMKMIIAKRMDSKSIKFMLNSKSTKGMLCRAGMDLAMADVKGNVWHCSDWLGSCLGNVLQGTVKLRDSFTTCKHHCCNTVDGMLNIVEDPLEVYPGNHAAILMEQQGLRKIANKVFYEHRNTNFYDPVIRKKLCFKPAEN